MRIRLACIVLTGASILAVGVADAGSIGRVKFVKRADNICQPQRNEAKRRVAHGVRLLERKHPLIRRAGRHFIRAYRELREAYRQVARLPRPPEDHKRIAKWLRRERQATAAGVRSAIALKRRHLAKARRLAHKAGVLEQDAARPVRNFDFQHCRPL
jgi:hypothetical protein